MKTFAFLRFSSLFVQPNQAPIVNSNLPSKIITHSNLNKTNFKGSAKIVGLNERSFYLE